MDTNQGCSANLKCSVPPGLYCNPATGCLPTCTCDYTSYATDGTNGCDVGQVCRRSCAIADSGVSCFASEEVRDCGGFGGGAGYVCRDSNGDGVIDDMDGGYGCELKIQKEARVPPPMPPYNMEEPIKCTIMGALLLSSQSLEKTSVSNVAAFDNLECANADQFCFLKPESCNTEALLYYGMCLPKPQDCSSENYAPVCGCDDETHDNACFAHSKGVSVSRQGECGKVPMELGEPTTLDWDPSYPVLPGGEDINSMPEDPRNDPMAKEPQVLPPMGEELMPEDITVTYASSTWDNMDAMPLPGILPYYKVGEEPCDLDSQCETGLVCHIPSGQCVCNMDTNQGCSANLKCSVPPGLYCNPATGCLPTCTCDYTSYATDGTNGCDVGQVCRRSCAIADSGVSCFANEEVRDCDGFGAGYVCRDSNGDGVIDAMDGEYGCELRIDQFDQSLLLGDGDGYGGEDSSGNYGGGVVRPHPNLDLETSDLNQEIEQLHDCASRLWHESTLRGVQTTCTNDDDYPEEWTTLDNSLFRSGRECCIYKGFSRRQCDLVNVCDELLGDGSGGNPNGGGGTSTGTPQTVNSPSYDPVAPFNDPYGGGDDGGPITSDPIPYVDSNPIACTLGPQSYKTSSLKKTSISNMAAFNNPAFTSEASCANRDQFCQLTTGRCNTKSLLHFGTCTPRPEFCTEEYNPVCGCNGLTYSNACFAHQAGASVSLEGRACSEGTVTDESVTTTGATATGSEAPPSTAISFNDPSTTFETPPTMPTTTTKMATDDEECLVENHCRSPSGRCGPRVTCLIDMCAIVRCEFGTCQLNSCGGCHAVCPTSVSEDGTGDSSSSTTSTVITTSTTATTRTTAVATEPATTAVATTTAATTPTTTTAQEVTTAITSRAPATTPQTTTEATPTYSTECQWHIDITQAYTCSNSGNYPSEWTDEIKLHYLFETAEDCCNRITSSGENCIVLDTCGDAPPSDNNLSEYSTDCEWHMHLNKAKACTNSDLYPLAWDSDMNKPHYKFESAEACCDAKFQQDCIIVEEGCTPTNADNVQEDVFVPLSDLDTMAIGDMPWDFGTPPQWKIDGTMITNIPAMGVDVTSDLTLRIDVSNMAIMRCTILINTSMPFESFSLHVNGHEHNRFQEEVQEDVQITTGLNPGYNTVVFRVKNSHYSVGPFNRTDRGNYGSGHVWLHHCQISDAMLFSYDDSSAAATTTVAAAPATNSTVTTSSTEEPQLIPSQATSSAYSTECQWHIDVTRATTCANTGVYPPEWDTQLPDEFKQYYFFDTAEDCCNATEYGEDCNVVDDCPQDNLDNKLGTKKIEDWFQMDYGVTMEIIDSQWEIDDTVSFTDFPHAATLTNIPATGLGATSDLVLKINDVRNLAIMRCTVVIDISMPFESFSLHVNGGQRNTYFQEVEGVIEITTAFHSGNNTIVFRVENSDTDAGFDRTIDSENSYGSGHVWLDNCQITSHN